MLRDETYRSLPHQRFSYLARGLYADQLRAWLQHFAKDQLLVI